MIHYCYTNSDRENPTVQWETVGRKKSRALTGWSEQTVRSNTQDMMIENAADSWCSQPVGPGTLMMRTWKEDRRHKGEKHTGCMLMCLGEKRTEDECCYFHMVHTEILGLLFQ